MAWFFYETENDNPLIAFTRFCNLFYIVQTIIGIPAHNLLERIKYHRLWAYALLGFVATSLPFVVGGFLFGCEEMACVGHLIHMSCYLGLLGAATGVIFWLIARPDKIVSEA